MAGMRYQPQVRLRVRPEWIQRGLQFAWVASLPGLNVVKSADVNVRVGDLVYTGGPRGIGASSFSYPAAGNRMISDPRISGFAGTGTFIAGGIAAGAGTLMSIGTAGQGVRTSVRNGFAAVTYMGVADYTTSISVPNGPATVGVAIGRNSATVLAKTTNGIASQTMGLGIPIPTTEPLRVGSTGASDEWPGSLEFAFQFAQTLTAAELRELANNPWALFADLYEDDEAVAAAAPNTYGLTAAPASFSLAGSGVTPRIARVLSAAMGSFALTGSLAGLAAARRLSAAPGAFSLAGPPITLHEDRVMRAASGAFGLAGAPASLSASRRLPAVAENFSLLAAAVVLAATRRLAAGSGGFALVGSTASLRTVRRLPAAFVAFGLSGSQAQLTYQQATIPEGGAQYRLMVTPGLFGLAGATLTLRVQRRLTAGQGAFSLASAVAVQAYGRRMPAATGVLNLQSVAVTLRAARRLPVDGGELDLVVAPVQLRYSAQIEHARAPAGSGYAPQRHEYQSRPAATNSPRPAATQRNLR